MYVRGAVTQIGGQGRRCIAALDRSGGRASVWNPNISGPMGPMVQSLGVAASGPIYAGGFFSTVGGLSRPNLACLDLTTGQPTSWNPGTNNQVHALAASGPYIFAGGDFTSCGGLARNYIAMLDT